MMPLGKYRRKLERVLYQSSKTYSVWLFASLRIDRSHKPSIDLLILRYWLPLDCIACPDNRSEWSVGTRQHNVVEISRRRTNKSHEKFYSRRIRKTPDCRSKQARPFLLAVWSQFSLLMRHTKKYWNTCVVEWEKILIRGEQKKRKETERKSIKTTHRGPALKSLKCITRWAVASAVLVDVSPPFLTIPPTESTSLNRSPNFCKGD